MNLRNYALLISVAIAVTGIIFVAAVPVSLHLPDGTTLACGTAINRDDRDVTDYNLRQQREQFAATLDVVTGLPTGPGSGTPRGGYVPVERADCDGPISTRQEWAIPLAAVGAVAFLGALTVRQRARKRDDNSTS